LGWLSYRVDALAALGRAEQARAAYERCAAPGLWRPYYGSLRWLESRVLEAEGRTSEAFEAAAAAVEEPGAEAFPFAQAVAALDAGRLAAATGATERARELLEAAATTFRRLGAAGYLARCVRLLDESAPVSSGIDPLAPLTTRERQVAHALAAGMTNKEIAERLYVSVTTVNFHVRNILSKLGLRSRRDLRSLSRRRPVKS
ncbi:MAG: response regulator transcription factor, partial [Leifsonia sp.]|nr:response regulator transcription factor [Leifsonia sp.]